LSIATKQTEIRLRGQPGVVQSCSQLVHLLLAGQPPKSWMKSPTSSAMSMPTRSSVPFMPGKARPPANGATRIVQGAKDR